MTKSLEERFQILHEFVAPARENLSAGHWDYLMGAAETEASYRRNRMAIDSLAFRHRVLRDVVDVDAGVEFLGQKLRLPIVLAPIGSLQDLVEGGGVVPTRAAARFGVMHMLSSVCAPGPEEVAAAVDYPKIFQIYVRGDPAWVDELVARAIDVGYSAICFTVDLDYYSKRERDLAKRFMTTARSAAVGEDHQKRFNWKDIERIRANCSVPLILKGIGTPEDAVTAADTGVDIVYASNHGGRQLDHCRGSLDTVSEIIEALDGRARTMVDGGFFRGSDIVKAMALGVDAIGIGRLQGLAAAAAGEDGIVRMLEILEQEVRSCLGLLGVKSFAGLDRSYVQKVMPLGAGSWRSAFPLLDEGY
jgi:glycolate oxidase